MYTKELVSRKTESVNPPLSTYRRWYRITTAEVSKFPLYIPCPTNPLTLRSSDNHGRSYWIPGSYAPALSEKGNSFLRLLKNKGFREESMTKVGVDAIGTSTTLESNKSQ